MRLSFLQILKGCKVVTQASAGFCGQTADKILNVDHHTVCKFNTRFDGYMDVLSRLVKLRVTLLNRVIGAPCTNSETKMVRSKKTSTIFEQVCIERSCLTLDFRYLGFLTS